MIITGVATMASTGRLIDRFRDRVVFPIIHDREGLGFIGRRHPDLSDIDRAGPKYLTPPKHRCTTMERNCTGLLRTGSWSGRPRCSWKAQ